MNCSVSLSPVSHVNTRFDVGYVLKWCGSTIVQIYMFDCYNWTNFTKI
jgi:hypothetical protein